MGINDVELLASIAHEYFFSFVMLKMHRWSLSAHKLENVPVELAGLKTDGMLQVI